MLWNGTDFWGKSSQSSFVCMKPFTQKNDNSRCFTAIMQQSTAQIAHGNGYFKSARQSYIKKLAGDWASNLPGGGLPSVSVQTAPIGLAPPILANLFSSSSIRSRFCFLVFWGVKCQPAAWFYPQLTFICKSRLSMFRFSVCVESYVRATEWFTVLSQQNCSTCHYITFLPYLA